MTMLNEAAVKEKKEKDERCNSIIHAAAATSSAYIVVKTDFAKTDFASSVRFLLECCLSIHSTVP
jgi:hypothetical protein